MKIQFLIFFGIVGLIVFLVYQGDKIDKQRDEQLHQFSDIHEESVSSDTIDDNIEDQSNVQDQQHIQRDNNSQDIVQHQSNEREEVQTDNDIQEDFFENNWLPAPSLDIREVSDINTPNFVEYGDPIKTSDTSFVYNQVRWFEIFIQYIDQELTCDDVTEFLTERLQAWYFWNTCRFISWDRWLKFNVLRLSWEEYIYERHYIDRMSSMYWILTLDRGEWIDHEMLPEKNIEFRDTEFPLIEIWDGLMAELIQANQ